MADQVLTPQRFAQALQQKRQLARRRRIKIISGLSALLVLSLITGYLLWFSPVLAARQINVAGNQLLSTEKIQQAAQIELGVSLLRQDTAAITARLETLPAVEKAQVKLQWPGTMTLQITERTAAVQLARANGYDWVDRHAVIFNHTTQPAKDIVKAEIKDLTDRLLQDVATVAATIPTELKPELVAIKADSVDNIRIELSGNREILWGSAEESQLKADVMKALRQVEAKVYDVSAPQNPTTR